MAFYAIQAGIAAGRTILAAGAMAIKAVADWAETAALLAMIVAQEGLNAALYACPLTWVIGLIVAVIVVIYLAVEAINYFCDANISVLGIVVGAFGRSVLLFSMCLLWDGTSSQHLLISWPTYLKTHYMQSLTCLSIYGMVFGNS